MNRRRPNAFVLVVAAAALGTATFAWWSVRGRGGSSQKSGGSEGPKAEVAEALGPSAGEPHMSEVAEMLRARAANGGQLIESFAQWASDSTALAARRAVLLAILSDPEPSKRLFLLLEAVSRLPIAPEQDPLWRNVVEGVSSMWHPGTIGVARDMLFTQEARPKARQLVISSLVDYTLSGRVAELTKGQKGELANDFIDLHYKLPPAQQSEVQSAVRRLVGDETAEVLRGNTAELERRWKQEMTATKKGLSENAYASPAPAPPAAALDEAGSVPAP